MNVLFIKMLRSCLMLFGAGLTKIGGSFAIRRAELHADWCDCQVGHEYYASADDATLTDIRGEEEFFALGLSLYLCLVHFQ